MKLLPTILEAESSPAAKVIALHCAMHLDPDVDHVVKPSHMSTAMHMSRVDYERGHREAVKAGWLKGDTPDRVRIPLESAARAALGLQTVASRPTTPIAPKPAPTKPQQKPKAEEA